MTTLLVIALGTVAPILFLRRWHPGLILITTRTWLALDEADRIALVRAFHDAASLRYAAKLARQAR